MQKTVFLGQKELGLELDYTFIPYYFGPFSKELQDDVYKLKRLGFIEIKEYVVEDPVTGAMMGFKKIYKITEKAQTKILDEEFKMFVTEKT
ncbi:hypothetical protein [Sulfurisphaera ohwakuensis]|uniref:Uncharacterized protein YwgA n=1 Tax=Sulfurisphaera ohwakuensis TaxID=69656 RepID=A0A7J9RYY3_SULOH|nr:hypothetical protein [Sulfurisphaera ohwakuensis]MBB5255279.1 uncharacterized protein YwgA [Sulfurisphaera ohwakuensis]